MSTDAQADKIIMLIRQMGVELVHDSAQVAFVVVPLITGVRSAYAIRSGTFRALIAKSFYEVHGKARNPAAMNDARAVLEGQAIHDGPLVDIALRVAGDEESIDLDLGDDGWRMVHITRDGWSVTSHGDRLFRRTPGMLALPTPVRGGTLDELREFVRTEDEGFALECAFLVNAVRPPWAVLILTLGAGQGLLEDHDRPRIARLG